MKVSCGVLLLNEYAELLLCHATGMQHWDVPKGLQDSGELPLQTALRELEEETGLRLSASRLLDLGLLAYLPAKKLRLFLVTVTKQEISLESLRCTSFFEHPRSRQQLPEVDDYAWVPVAELSQFCTTKLCATLGTLGQLRA